MYGTLSAMLGSVSAHAFAFPATWVASLSFAVPMAASRAFIARNTVTLLGAASGAYMTGVSVASDTVGVCWSTALSALQRAA